MLNILFLIICSFSLIGLLNAEMTPKVVTGEHADNLIKNIPQEVSGSYQIFLESDKEEVDTNEEILLFLTIRNITEDELVVPMGTINEDYKNEIVYNFSSYNIRLLHFNSRLEEANDVVFESKEGSFTALNRNLSQVALWSGAVPKLSIRKGGQITYMVKLVPHLKDTDEDATKVKVTIELNDFEGYQNQQIYLNINNRK